MSDDDAAISPIELPELREALLDDVAVKDLLGDIEQFGELIGVGLQGQPRRFAGEQNISLADAARKLLAGEARGIQILYVHQGKEWWDTLMRTPGGTRLVRIEAPVRSC